MFKKLINIKTIVQSMNKSYTHSRQHVFHSGVELDKTNILSEKIVRNHPNFKFAIDTVINLANDSDEDIIENKIYKANELLDRECIVPPNSRSIIPPLATIKKIYTDDKKIQVCYKDTKSNGFMYICCIEFPIVGGTSSSNVGTIYIYTRDFNINPNDKNLLKMLKQILIKKRSSLGVVRIDCLMQK